MTQSQTRLQKLRQQLREQKLDAFFIYNYESSDQPNLYYSTGFPGSAGFLFITPKRAVLLSDPRYGERLRKETQGLKIVVKQPREKLVDKIAEVFKDLGVRKVGFNASRMTVEQLHDLVKAFEKNKVRARLKPIVGFVERLRVIKDEHEIAAMKKAQKITDKTFDYILGRVKPGKTEREIAWEMEVYMRTNGADKLAFESIVATGANSALPHYDPGNVKIKKGDFLLFDFGASVDGYCADMTRTVVVGKPSAEQEKVYHTVLNALNNTLNNLKDGLKGKQGDKFARDVITKAKYGDKFGHGTGHGVGLEVHEGPSLSLLSKSTLKSGMVVTVEPGIYLSGWGGVRIEDMAVIQNGGCVSITGAPKKQLISV
jgi:Xaa-Pro aminopeptidase